MAEKYSSDELDDMVKKGHALKNADGDPSYPIKDEDDLDRAIKAVGRGGADHDAIRRHIMKRADALGLSKMIPDNWNQDGSLRAAGSEGQDCDLCDGSGKIRGGKVTCPQCKGSGTQPDDKKSGGPMLEWRRKKAGSLSGLERRSFAASGLEMRESPGGTLRLTGYASLTDTPYEMGFYEETIQRGAFRRTLGENPDVQLLVNHEGLPLARTKSGTLRLSEDERGLRVEADLDAEDPDVQSLARKMRRGDIDQMSFAFQANEQDWNDDYTQRTIRVLSIHRGDVSVVNQGANGATLASIRSRETVEALQRCGFDLFLESLVEWRDLTLLPVEERAGKTLSANTTEILTKVLALVQKSDDAGDAAIPMLAELLQVPNPNAPGTHDGDGVPTGKTDGGQDAPPASTATDGSSRSARVAERAFMEQQALRALRKKAS